MKQDKADKISDLFDTAEETFPDKSTAFLMEIVVQRARDAYRMEIDHGDVAEALSKTKPK